MRELVIDAGPLIALFYRNDPQHQECDLGFQQLGQRNIRLFTPIPIVFEVYKWLLQRGNVTIAQATLDSMVKGFSLVPVNQEELLGLQTFIRQIPDWRSSLEDATVIATAFRYD